MNWWKPWRHARNYRLMPLISLIWILSGCSPDTIEHSPVHSGKKVVIPDSSLEIATFFYENEQGPNELFIKDLASGKKVQITHQKQRISDFIYNKHRDVIYFAQSERDADQNPLEWLGRRIAVNSPDRFSGFRIYAIDLKTTPYQAKEIPNRYEIFASLQFLTSGHENGVYRFEEIYDDLYDILPDQTIKKVRRIDELYPPSHQTASAFGEGSYVIMNAASQTCLAKDTRRMSDTEDFVTIDACVENDSKQQWRFEKVDNRFYKMVNRATQRCLAVNEWPMIYLWPCDESQYVELPESDICSSFLCKKRESLYWSIEPEEDAYRMIDAFDARCLQQDEGKLSNWKRECSGNNGLWYIKKQ